MEVDHSIDVFRLKKLFHRLDNAKVTGSVVTIVIPPKKNVSEMSNKLLEEIGKAAQIKDKTNRQAVVEAQSAARERLKLSYQSP